VETNSHSPRYHWWITLIEGTSAGALRKKSEQLAAMMGQHAADNEISNGERAELLQAFSEAQKRDP